MGYRIWIAAHNLTFVADDTVTTEAEARRIAKDLFVALPDAVVGINRVETVEAFVAPIRPAPQVLPVLRSGEDGG